MPNLSVRTLKTRIAALQKKLAVAESSKAPAVKKVKALMKKLGVTIEDLAGKGESARPSARRRGRPRKGAVENPAKSPDSRKVAVKYRDETGNTWTGRGKTPRWLVEAEKAGKTRDAFKI